jgi:hypothetical protein
VVSSMLTLFLFHLHLFSSACIFSHVLIFAYRVIFLTICRRMGVQ